MLSDHRITANIFISDREYHYPKYPASIVIRQIRTLIADKIAKKLHEEFFNDPITRTIRVHAELYVFTETELLKLFKDWEDKFCEKYNFANPIIF